MKHTGFIPSAAVGTDVTDDLTILRLDVDAEAMKALLEAIPGVEPADLEPPATDTDDGEATSSASSPATERTGPRVGETPPPGAGDQVTISKESGGRSRRRLALFAGGGVAVLAVVGAVATVFSRRRKSDDRDAFDIGDSLPIGDDETDDYDETVGHDDDVGETGRIASKTDGAPVLGMAVLAVGAVVVRRMQSSE